MPGTARPTRTGLVVPWGGSVVSTSSPAANSVNQLVELLILNYMGLMGHDGQFPTLFPMQGLGSASTLAGMTVFAPIV